MKKIKYIILLGPGAGNDYDKLLKKIIKRYKDGEKFDDIIETSNFDGDILLKEFETEKEKEAYIDGANDAFGWVSYWDYKEIKF